MINNLAFFQDFFRGRSQKVFRGRTLQIFGDKRFYGGEGKTLLTLNYMGYFDYLVYMKGGAKKPPGLTLAFDFRQS